METSYDIRIYKILTYKGSRKTSHTVRWVVAGKAYREPFATFAPWPTPSGQNWWRRLAAGRLST
ncbi:hypothetical protein [Streptomyces sp. NPDC051219]|uniref:hypothetical protein n=1 Tax=Streptomyces sp. NPDC051219 TaxID=3155283 RepID=UPI00341202A9